MIECRPADLIEPELEKYREESKDFAKCEEDVLSYALFPQVAKKFFDVRDGRTAAPAEKKEAPKAEKKAPVDADGVRVLYVQDVSAS